MSVDIESTDSAIAASSTALLGGALRVCFKLTSSFPKLVVAPNVIGEIHYGLKPTYIPNSPGWFRGVVNRRGALVPIFDLTLWLGLGRDSSTERRGVLLFDSAPKAAGIWILGEPNLATIVENNEADRSTFPDTLLPYLTQGYESDDGSCFEFDHVSWFRLAGGRSML